MTTTKNKLNTYMLNHYRTLPEIELNKLVDNMSSKEQISIIKDVITARKTIVDCSTMSDKDFLKFIKSRSFCGHKIFTSDLYNYFYCLNDTIRKSQALRIINKLENTNYNINDIVFYKDHYVTRDLKYFTVQNENYSSWYRTYGLLKK